MENKNVKLYYTVGEVAKILGENTSLVRFWSDSFPKFIRPSRNAKGNRLFSAEDLENFKIIHMLVNVEGLTLEGVAKRLRDDRKGSLDRMRAIETLTSIREKLVEIRDML